MKIAIQGHPTRGKEVIQLLENLGGINEHSLLGTCSTSFYYVNKNNYIKDAGESLCDYTLYTLEEFEKEFPFKIGDKVKDASDNEIGIITDLISINNILIYNVDFVNSGQAFMPSEQLKPYKEMKEERNITLTLDKAKEWYKKGGELREIALQAFSEKELNPLPRSWEEFSRKYKICSTRYAMPSKYAALYQLEQLRDCWWNGWEPNWLEGNEKYVIQKWRDTISIDTTYVTHSFLSFLTYEMAKEFLECFRDLIEQAGDLI
jgi:hypothetical protein